MAGKGEKPVAMSETCHGLRTSNERRLWPLRDDVGTHTVQSIDNKTKRGNIDYETKQIITWFY